MPSTPPPTSLTTGFAHVGIRVHELERSRAFYELLGFEFVAGPLGSEPVAILHHPGGFEINLVLNAPEADTPNVLMDVQRKKPGYTHIALTTTDIADAQRVLEAHGITITEGPFDHPDGTRALFFRDPDRNVIELNQRP